MRSLKLILLIIVCALSKSADAKNYVFFGTGEWTNTANWTGGLTPWSGGFTNADTITISGTTGVGVNCTFNCPFGTLSGNQGTIIIAAGGSFTFQNFTQFSNQGKIIVNGTMTNKTTFEVYNGSNIIVNGILNNEKTIGNQGTVTINSGGVLNNRLTGIFTNTGFAPGFSFPTIGTLVINNGGTFNNTGTATLKVGNLTNHGTLNNQSNLASNGTITGSLTNGGTMSPGDSPGAFTINGDYTALPSAIHKFEVGGTAANSYDRLNVSGNVTLDGTLSISLINGYNPASGPDIPIISGNINGSFAVINKPSKYLVVYNSNGIVLRYSATLPVSFTSVNVQKQHNGAFISWKIENEEGVSHYEIEKSRDGQSFKKIGQVSASALTRYSYTDFNPDTKSFYRIKSVDHDGKRFFSAIVHYIQERGSVALKLYPTLTTTEVTIQHDNAGPASKILVLSPAGNVVRVVLPANDTQNTRMNVAALQAGVYLIKYENRFGEVETVKFIKQ